MKKAVVKKTGKVWTCNGKVVLNIEALMEELSIAYGLRGVFALAHVESQCFASDKNLLSGATLGTFKVEGIDGTFLIPQVYVADASLIYLDYAIPWICDMFYAFTRGDRTPTDLSILDGSIKIISAVNNDQPVDMLVVKRPGGRGFIIADNDPDALSRALISLIGLLDSQEAGLLKQYVRSEVEEHTVEGLVNAFDKCVREET